MVEDFYDVLEVNNDATPDEINDSFRRLAKKYHPDASDADNASEKFKTVQVARDILIDPEMREEYDRLGHTDFTEAYIEEELEGFKFTSKSKSTTSKKRGSTNSGNRTKPSTSSGSSKSSNTATNNTSKTSSTKGSSKRSNKKTRSGRNRSNKSKSRNTGSSNTSTSSSNSSNTTTTRQKKKVKQNKTIEKEYKSDIAESIRDNINVEDPTTSSTDSLVFKPRVNTKLVTMVGFVIISTLMYLGSYALLLFTQENITSVGGIVEYTLNDVNQAWINATVLTSEQLFGILFISCLVLITVTITSTVYIFGNRSTWMYPPATLIPIIAVIYTQVAGAVSSFILFVVLFIVPLAVVSVFVIDVVGALTKNYLEYYWAKLTG